MTNWIPITQTAIFQDNSLFIHICESTIFQRGYKANISMVSNKVKGKLNLESEKSEDIF